jgi:hypothetical protein
VKLTTPEPELLAENNPVKVAANESLPAIGTVCVMVSVNVPDAAIAPLPETNVWKLPKLEPVGVFKLVDPRPVNVTMNALPMPPKKVTELLPLPAQPAHVKIPDVEKVTGSAFALDVPSATTASSSALIRVALKKPAILFPFSLASMGTSAPALNEGNDGFTTHLKFVILPLPGKSSIRYFVALWIFQQLGGRRETNVHRLGLA